MAMLPTPRGDIWGSWETWPRSRYATKMESRKVLDRTLWQNTG